MKPNLFPALCLTTLLAVTAAPAALAQDHARQLSERCMLCHGERGENHLLGIPRIGGREFYDLLATMSRFRTGERLHPVMSAIMQSVDEVEMVEVAGYFSEQAGAGIN
ncbi:MAG TPA: hypothetical protein PLW81_03965 [Thiobacillaceae bacterium]|nr:hypothetical protein [Thiobacillaceae bacterium]